MNKDNYGEQYQTNQDHYYRCLVRSLQLVMAAPDTECADRIWKTIDEISSKLSARDGGLALGTALLQNKRAKNTTLKPEHLAFMEKMKEEGPNGWKEYPADQLKKQFPELSAGEADDVMCAWLEQYKKYTISSNRPKSTDNGEKTSCR